ncbi:MAG: molybdopterin cofactor-binding domain-containing protein [Rubrivivax sp.]
MKRRHLLLAGAAGGALLVGWGLLPVRSRLGSGEWDRPAAGMALNGWIRIGADGAVRLAMPRSEMGQGVHTALAMLAAEELDLALDAVQLVPGGHETLYGNVAMASNYLWFGPRAREPGAEHWQLRASEWVVAKLARELGINATGGSSSVTDAWGPVRLAAATARAQLLGAASLEWKLPVDDLVCRDGIISHPSGPRAHFGEFAARAVLTPVSDVTPKPRAAWRLVGTPARRIDLPAKTDGRAVFGLDVRQPGQVYAVVRHCPMIGGAPGRIDPSPALALPGVERVVRLGPFAGATGGLAVVGRSTWHALQGARAVQVEWLPRPAGTLDSAAIEATLAATARRGADDGERGFTFHATGDAPAALQRAARTVEAFYSAPYLPHLTMEPPNCTARVAEGRVEVWAPTQVPGLARAIAARVAGVPEEAVTLHVTYLGGGFGRRLEVDSVGQAVRVALETGGRPVQLVWPREEDVGHDIYRPAAAAWLRAGFDAAGGLEAITISSAGDAVVPRWLERNLPGLAGPIDLPDKSMAEGLLDLPYQVPHLHVAHRATHSGVPVGFWRSVGHSHNAFFSESFVDELAHAAGADPVAFRLARLRDLPRHAAVLQRAASAAGWGAPLPAGRARGVALHESFGSIVAQVFEVSLEAAPAAAGARPRPRVHRVVCAVDCGTVVHPPGVVQQVESGILFGLAAALHHRIDIVGGVVQQQNFPDLPLVTLADAPVIETHLLPSERPPAGVGEIAVPPVAPALANALFALTGQRLRALPLRP